MSSHLPFPRLTYAQKLSLVAAIPLILAVAAIAVLVANQSRALAEREIQALETQMIEAKKRELRNYVTQARNGFYFIYGSAAPNDQDAKNQVTQILSAMIYGDEGFFFVYDYDGINLVSPRQTEMINNRQPGQTGGGRPDQHRPPRRWIPYTPLAQTVLWRRGRDDYLCDLVSIVAMGGGHRCLYRRRANKRRCGAR